MSDVRGWQRRLSPLLDPAITLAVLIVSMVPLLQGYEDSDDPVPGWAYVLVLALCLPLLVRRRWPLAVVIWCGSLTVVYGVSSLPDPNVPYAGLVAVYTVTAHTDRVLAIVTAVVSAFSITLSMVIDWSHVDAEDLTVNYLIFATAWLLGDGARRRRDRAAELEQRAADLERTRAAQALAAAEAERNRIARDMHDVVAHHLSMMVVQAEAGPVAIEGDPRRAEEAFDAISSAGKEALVEMRRLLGVLKSEEAAPLAPQRGVASIEQLVDRVRAAGIDVRVRCHVGDEPIPTAVDVSAYRIAQEALTNSVRHGHPDRVDVTVERGDGALTIEVVDDGIGGVAEPGGHGLIAMRERVGLVGGQVEAGPCADGGWSVRATMPLDAGEPR
ncbi:sensor histidine kinase [Solicola gregarius]|uniref:histidine kinase n=1 Tax=Solicola gregarius TaxID=2908642 RepID=A0AA46TEH9_9ACTN|nr:sensor histidine kinase [Solicola gregarius]UYM03877.1 sensor histidine kinase [Solicola gregarius]